MTAIATFIKNGWDVNDKGSLVTQPGPGQPGFFSAPFGNAVLNLVGMPIGAPFNSLMVKIFVFTRRLSLTGAPLPADGVDTGAYSWITEGVPNTPPLGVGGVGASGPIWPPGGFVGSSTSPPYASNAWGAPVNLASAAMLAAYAPLANSYGLIAAPPPPAPPVQPIGIETVVAIFVATVFTGGQLPGPWVFEVDAT